MNVKKYIVPETLEEAIHLLEKKSNRLVGGNHWLKQGKQTFNGISLDRLDLNYIHETENEIIIGGATPLRDVELNKTIREYFPHIKDAYQHIVGVQLRNTATIGASVYSRFGFSDIVSTLLLLNTEVELNGSEIVILDEYVLRKRKKEIVTKVIIKKEKLSVRYYPMRYAQTDLPFFIFGLSKNKDNYKVVCGARPQNPFVLISTSELLKDGLSDKVIDKMLEEAKLSSNAVASKEYREHLAKTLLKRGVLEIG
jgi:CO/xanthine dehydrogenase FAD-binding subunit